MKREQVLGVALGLSAGVLVDSCMIVLFSLLIVFISPILLVPPVAGVLLGLRSARAGRLPSWNWPKIILMGFIFLILAALLPYLVAAGELRWHGRQIPVPPDSTTVQVQTGPLGSSMAGPSVTHIFETGTGEEAVLSYYQKELGEDGWQMFSDLENGAWFVKSGRHMFVRLHEKQDLTIIAVTYNRDRVLGPWFILLVTLVCFFYVWFRSHRPNRS